MSAEDEAPASRQPLHEMLRNACAAVRLSEGRNQLLVPEEPVALLEEIIEEEIERRRPEDDAEWDEEMVREGFGWGEGFEEAIAERGGAFQKLLSFSWAGFVDEWTASLEFLIFEGRSDEIFVCYVHEPADWGAESPCGLIGVFSPELSAELVTPFVHSIFASNGRDYGVAVLGSLPSRLTNHRPDLIRWEGLAPALSASLDARPDRWGELREQLELDALQPDSKDQLRSLLGDVAEQGVSGYLEGVKRRSEEAAELSASERSAIMTVYRERCYDEE